MNRSQMGALRSGSELRDERRLRQGRGDELRLPGKARDRRSVDESNRVRERIGMC